VSAFWIYTITGIICGWPPAALGMWITWYLANRKVQRITEDQTKVIRSLTNRQTGQLLGTVPLPEAYKGHEPGPGTGQGDWPGDNEGRPGSSGVG
jgi:hypothetical protein